MSAGRPGKKMKIHHNGTVVAVEPVEPELGILCVRFTKANGEPLTEEERQHLVDLGLLQAQPKGPSGTWKIGHE